MANMNKLYYRLFNIGYQYYTFDTYGYVPQHVKNITKHLKQCNMTMLFPNYIGIVVHQLDTNVDKLLTKAIYKDMQISKNNKSHDIKIQKFGLTYVHNKWFVTCNKFTGDANEKLLLDACKMLNYSIVTEESTHNELNDITFTYSEFGEIKWCADDIDQFKTKFILNQINDKINETIMNKKTIMS